MLLHTPVEERLFEPSKRLKPTAQRHGVIPHTKAILSHIRVKPRNSHFLPISELKNIDHDPTTLLCNNGVQQSKMGVAISCAWSHHPVTCKFTELSPRQQMQDCSQLHDLAVLISEKENEMSTEHVGVWVPDPTGSFDTNVASLCRDRTSPQPVYCTDCTLPGSTSEAKMHFMLNTFMVYIIYLLTHSLTYSLLTYSMEQNPS